MLEEDKKPNTDLFWFIEIRSSNHIVDIKRSYLTILDVFAAVGGLIQFITVFIIAAYNSYNSYKMFKHII